MQLPIGNLTDEADILRFEVALGRKLPAAYRSFLKNGFGGQDLGRLRLLIPLGLRSTYLSSFRGFGTGATDLLYGWKLSGDRLHVYQLPIADDSFGNWILLDLNSGGIYFRDNDSHDEVKLSDNFETFVENLRSDAELEPFALACQTNDEDLLKSFCRQPALVDRKNSEGKTLLEVACRCGNLHYVRELMEAGACIKNAVPDAVLGGVDDVVRWLVDHGADVNARHLGTGATGYNLARLYGRNAIANLLQEAGGR